MPVLAEIEDIFKWRSRRELNHGVLLGNLRDGGEIITSESLFGIDWNQRLSTPLEKNGRTLTEIPEADDAQDCARQSKDGACGDNPREERLIHERPAESARDENSTPAV